MAVGEELNGVNIGLVASKSLNGLAGSDIPKLGEGIASTGNESVLVGRVQADAHHIAKVVRKLGNLLTSLDIPLHTSHIAGRGEDASVVDKSTA